MAYYLSAGVIIIFAAACKKKIEKNSKKSHSAENCRTVPKIVAQCRKLSHSAENTLFHIFIHWIELYHYLNTLDRTIPYLNTLWKNPNLNKTMSAANQNRVCQNPIPYLNTLSNFTLS